MVGISTMFNSPMGVYLPFTKCEICSKLTFKTYHNNISSGASIVTDFTPCPSVSIVDSEPVI